MRRILLGIDSFWRMLSFQGGMHKIIFLFCVVLGLSGLQPVMAYEHRDLLKNSITRETLSSNLDPDALKGICPSYTDREGWDAFFGETRAAVIERGEKFLEYEWQQITASDYLRYEQIGERQIMGTKQRANANALSALFWAEMAEGSGRFLPQIIDGAFHFCEQTTWCLSAHVTYQKHTTSFPVKGDDFIDFLSAEIGSQLSWISFLLGDELDKINKFIDIRIRQEVKAHIVDQYLRNDDFFWMALQDYEPGVTIVNNWTPWTSINVLQCILLSDESKETMVDAVYKGICSVDEYLNYLKSDGCCEEGAQYWSASAGNLYYFLEMMDMVTGSSIGIFDKEQLRGMAEYPIRTYVGNGYQVNFGDCDVRGRAPSTLVFGFGKAVGSENAMSFAAAAAAASLAAGKPRSRPSGFDIFNTFVSMKLASEMYAYQGEFVRPSVTFYPETEVCYLTDDERGIFFAAKGGHNRESHNHNDVGSFALYKNCIPLLIDIGTSYYTAQTTGPQRYQYPMNRSRCHNIPEINGFEERDGAEFKSDSFALDKRRKCLSIGIAGAFPDSAGIERWTRSYRLRRDRLDIIDEFSLREILSANKLNFMTSGELDLSVPGKIVITYKGESVVLNYDTAVFELDVEELQWTDKRLTKNWGPSSRRIELTARTLQKTGRYQCSISFKRH